ncbi:MAG: hypothetical protein A2162_11860 [Deltaproteobacteria bacterium RBG_13_52_11b]|nr:MAG: hypothetical protein A2162_11860 [Deltaproteobacteria bacterium RBG_13_52_11b]
MVLSADAVRTNPKERFNARGKIREQQGYKTMTFEKWMDEISKGQILRIQEVRNLNNTVYDAFAEDDEEEEPKRPQLKKN